MTAPQEQAVEARRLAEDIAHAFLAGRPLLDSVGEECDVIATEFLRLTTLLSQREEELVEAREARGEAERKFADMVRRYSVAVEVGGREMYGEEFGNGAEAADAMSYFEREVDRRLAERDA